MPSALPGRIRFDECDSDDAADSLVAVQDPLAYVPGPILEVLRRLDVSDSIVESKKVYLGNGALGEICAARVKVEEGKMVAVALKQVRTNKPREISEIFEKELYVWSKLDHRNVLPLVGYAFDKDGFLMLVSQRVRKGSAFDLITNKEEYDLMRLVIGIAKGLRYLHDHSYEFTRNGVTTKGVIHSDIKPANILVSKDGDALICDFGCARMIDASRSLGVMTYRQKGTLRYMASELLNNEGDETPYSKAADVWAFGMTVLELFTRQVPYANLSDRQVDSAIKDGSLPKLPKLIDSDQTGIKRFLWDKICQPCWRLEPGQRITMAAVMSELGHFQKPTYILKANGDLRLKGP